MFLHGVGSTGEIWQPQMVALASAARCIAPDYRGYGRSDIPPPASLQPESRDAQAITRAAFARDVLCVLDQCGLSSAHLCGCSLGGVVALECYAQAPPRVRSLILVDTFAYYPRGAEHADDRIRALDELGIVRFAQSRAAGVVHPDAPPERIELVRSQMRCIPLDVYKAATRATWTGDYRDMIPGIAVPVLVMWGERDTAIAPYERSAEIAHSLHEPAQVLVVPHAGHLPNVDNPEFFNAAVLEFINRI